MLSRIAPHYAMAYWRAPMSGWPTAARVHTGGEGLCVFGCSDAHDFLGQYLQCPTVRAVLATYVVSFGAESRGPRAVLGLGSVERAQRAGAAMGIMMLYIAYCAARARGGGAAEARAHLRAVARVTRLRVGDALQGPRPPKRGRRRG